MNTIFIRAVIISFTTLLIPHTSQAQDKKYDLELNYTTELQSDFGEKANWVNLLTLGGSYKLWQSGELSLQTISIYKIREKCIIDDLQTFSNIEEDNMAINIFLIGYTHRLNHLTLFGGIRNVNNDYFTGKYTSLFTNSSCGIYPTLSINFPLANYPLSSMCIHGEFELSKSLTLKNSLYNGAAHKLWSKEGSVFALNPKKEGIMNVSELSYLSKTHNYGFYTIGSILSTATPLYTNVEQEEAKQEKKTEVNYTLWGSIEKNIYINGSKSVGVLFQGSFSPNKSNNCKSYFGAGAILI